MAHAACPDGGIVQFGGVPCVVRDLHTHYDQALLSRLYFELMVPNFPIEDELMPFEDIRRTAADAEQQNDPHTFTQLIRILVDDSCDDPPRPIVAAHVSEYYTESQCGLLAYFVTNEAYRGKGVGRWLANDAVASMHGERVAWARLGVPSFAIF